MKVLVTGATGKVGQNFIPRFLAEPAFSQSSVRAFCHKRVLEEEARLEVIQGKMSSRQDVSRAVEGISHVVHLATCKETPDQIMDTTVKGLFWLLEGCRESPTFRRFIMVGGDSSMGHFFYPHPAPVTEQQPHSAYPGCYALSKVLEEVMLEQYYIQYDLDGCCLRAPWIMEKDDFRFTLSFGEDVFGGPRWRDIVGKELAAEYQKQGTVPVMVDPIGVPILRNFVHVDDLADAILKALDHPAARQQLFNICMDEPVDYRETADYLRESRGLPSVEVPTKFYGNWMDNSKAKFLLGWRPQYDLKRLIDSAWEYQRSPDEPRVVWYPG
ncbi:MAG TPA: NAD(P)-dependent oxidoreductase [Acidobacteriota bacterium]|nr:NAD(P)-dependent oxidoreductase [Acidobacteriota bacterium]